MSISNLFTENAKPWQNLKVNSIHTLEGISINSHYKIIASLNDLPSPVAGVISLEPITYVIAGNIDLDGNRLLTTGSTTLVGGSSETSSITSTGLSAGIPLITSHYTLAIQFLTIKGVDTAISIDGNGSTVALDWTGVNFTNIPNIGTINKCENFIYTKGAFLNSQGLIFDGIHGTIGFNNSLFQGDGSAGNIIEITATANIIRRFRIIYSSIIAFGSTVGLNVSPSATIGNEQYILDTVNFSGGGTYLSGVLSNDNKALFLNCVGIDNSGDISQYYMNNNATTTVIAVANTPYKVLGTTTSAPVTQKFTNTANRATYVGALMRYFKITATLSALSGNNNQIGCYIAKNGTVLPESEIYITCNGSGRAEAAMIQTLAFLSNGDYIEIFVENSTTSNNITVTDLNVVIN